MSDLFFFGDKLHVVAVPFAVSLTFQQTLGQATKATNFVPNLFPEEECFFFT